MRLYGEKREETGYNSEEEEEKYEAKKGARYGRKCKGEGQDKGDSKGIPLETLKPEE